MKKYILFLGVLMAALFHASGQVGGGFSSVPVVNGKVVFEQFILTGQDLSSDQQYAILQKWVKDKFTGSPLVSGIRFDEKNRSVTVSAKAELSGLQDVVVMNYRFDLSVASAGCVLLVRDITYQDSSAQGGSSFPKNIAAEQTITDQAVAVSGDEGEKRKAIRKATLSVVNDLYSQVSGLF